MLLLWRADGRATISAQGDIDQRPFSWSRTVAQDDLTMTLAESYG